MNKFLLSILSFFLLTTLFADEGCKEPFMAPPDSTCSGCLTDFAVLHSSIPCIDRCHTPCWEGTFTASFLMWQAKEDGLNFAINNKAPSAPNFNLDLRGNNVKPDFKWKPAFKAALGIIFPACDWNLIAEYTRYYSHMNTNTRASLFGDGAGLLPAWDIPGFIDLDPTFQTANAHWKLKFNSADLSLGHNFFISKYLSFRFHGGLKGLIIDQRYFINYNSPLPGIFDQLLSLNFQFNNDSRGIGPRVGVESKWYFPGYGGHVLANIAGSSVLQQFRVSFHQNGLAAETFLQEQAKITHKVWVFRPCLEMLLGYGWGFCYGCKNDYYFGMKFAYEAQFFWQQNLMYRLTEVSVWGQGVQYQGDLVLHGGTLTFEFNF